MHLTVHLRSAPLLTSFNFYYQIRQEIVYKHLKDTSKDAPETPQSRSTASPRH